MLFADDAALVAHRQEALQRLITCFSTACKEFGLTISLKKTEVMGQDVSATPEIKIDEHNDHVPKELGIILKTMEKRENTFGPVVF